MDELKTDQEVFIFENELLGIRLVLASRKFKVDELQIQGLETLKKIIKEIPTRIPLGVG